MKDEQPLLSDNKKGISTTDHPSLSVHTDETLTAPLDEKESKETSVAISHPKLQTGLKAHYLRLSQASFLKSPSLIQTTLSQKIPVQKKLDTTVKESKEKKEAVVDSEEKETKKEEEKSESDKEIKKKAPFTLVTHELTSPTVAQLWRERLTTEESVYSLQTQILVPQILQAESTQTPIKRALIRGDFGTGKTTLCQSIAYQWSAKELWADRFDYVFYIPLQFWLKQRWSEKNPSLVQSFMQFFQVWYQKEDYSFIDLDSLTDVLTTRQDRTLLILDGYESVSNILEDVEHPDYPLLIAALTFPQAIVTSSRYSKPPEKIVFKKISSTVSVLNNLFDRELIALGFVDSQISHYLQHFFQKRTVLGDDSTSKEASVLDDKTFLIEEKYEEKMYIRKEAKIEIFEEEKDEKSTPKLTEAKMEVQEEKRPINISKAASAFMEHLKQNPRLWGLAHIPAYLTQISEHWAQSAVFPHKISGTGELPPWNLTSFCQLLLRHNMQINLGAVPL